ncbi:UTP--glucose-1-phosphate uridylyltransferase [Candidatus Peregrinibacteria bacterium CG10_big_fil_rev_8_21_14_0_10_55_24]|nr:MAG: UTP--glucose-1-phosphate uridylyltransferase [Candidatus Peregrinibacteria bacterium CG10_big_fil_rev_8_21_14_0_10_55_24]
MKITKAILPVAGLGTRFLPWTKVVPKELLPIGNRPIIAHLVDECLDAGISDICFVISRGKEAIPQYFAHDTKLAAELDRRGKLHHLEELKRYDSVRFTTVYQDEQLGDGHAILQAASWVGNAPIAVLFGDDLFLGKDPGLTQLLQAYEYAENGAVIALENVPKEDVERYGIVEVESEHPKNPRLKKLKSLMEKPSPEEAPSTLGIVGRYILPRKIFDQLVELNQDSGVLRQKMNVLTVNPDWTTEKFFEGKTEPIQDNQLWTTGTEIRIIDALIRALPTTPIHGLECEGTRLDTGTPQGYAKAVQAWHERQ